MGTPLFNFLIKINMIIEKDSLISKLNTYKINENTIYQYAKEIDKCNRFYNLTNLLGVADEPEGYELNKKFTKVSRTIKQVDQDPNSFAVQNINHLKQQHISAPMYRVKGKE